MTVLFSDGKETNMKIQQRHIVYAKDVVEIFGCSLRTAQRLIQKVRSAVGKEPGDYITIPEFCDILGIEEKLVRECINEDIKR